jgi:YD repeat-containing protein
VTLYTYDDAGRLTGLQHINAITTVLASYVYTYDDGGRLKTERANGNPVVTYAYDNANQVTSDAYASYTWDAAGNATSNGFPLVVASRVRAAYKVAAGVLPFGLDQ